jgi:hypothetical protein
MLHIMRTAVIALLALTSSGVALDPPPFGTVVGQWDLQMSGAYAGAGITWRRDSGLLYLMDQGFSGLAGVRKLDPADPPGTIRADSWVFADLGSTIEDIPWGICWDPDSGCFWISQIVDGNIYGGCYLMRMAWRDSAWCWRGTPADSWMVSDSLFYWVAGMAKRVERSYFIGAGIRPPPLSGLFRFDPYTKTMLGTIGQVPGIRIVALVPADSYYIITHDTTSLMKLDSAGQLLQRASPGPLGPADMELVIPRHPGPDDTVFLYAICSNSTNTLQKVSAGLLWGQLKAGQAIAEPTPSPAQPSVFRIEPNPCRGSATVRFHSPLSTPYSLSLSDAAGRCVRDLAASGRTPAVIDVKGLNAGVYFLQVETEGLTHTAKLIVER